MMSQFPDKARVVEALRAQLEADLDAALQAHARAVEGATHEEARPEHDKDTRATEASYLARGLARRVVELREVATALQHAALERSLDTDALVDLGALVTTEDADGRLAHYLVASHGGGLQVTLDEVTIRVVTPDSPLGAALVGSGLDDTVSVKSPGGARELTIVAMG